jgi:hypothetical protein
MHAKPPINSLIESERRNTKDRTRDRGRLTNSIISIVSERRENPVQGSVAIGSKEIQLKLENEYALKVSLRSVQLILGLLKTQDLVAETGDKRSRKYYFKPKIKAPEIGSRITYLGSTTGVILGVPQSFRTADELAESFDSDPKSIRL